MPILVTLGAVPPPDPPPDSVNPDVAGASPLPAVALELSWSGADGSQWALTSPTSQVRLLPGMRGLEAGDMDRWTSDAPGLAGSRYRGARALPREVYLPVYVRGATSGDWLAVRRAWDRSLSPDDEGVLTAVVDGTRRTLPCRWVRTEASWSRDPLLAARAVLGEYLEAGGAYWQGDAVRRSWIASGDAQFFVPSGAVFYISPSNTLGAARIDNPGDVPTWPVWTITGPCATASVGVDGAEIEIPFAIGSGHWLRIDTRPDQQNAVDDTGADRVSDLGAVAFRPIPARMSVEVSLGATGTGTGFSASAELTPLYRRAW